MILSNGHKRSQMSYLELPCAPLFDDDSPYVPGEDVHKFNQLPDIEHHIVDVNEEGALFTTRAPLVPKQCDGELPPHPVLCWPEITSPSDQLDTTTPGATRHGAVARQGKSVSRGRSGVHPYNKNNGQVLATKWTLGKMKPGMVKQCHGRHRSVESGVFQWVHASTAQETAGLLRTVRR